MPFTSKRRLLAGAICAVTLLLACHDDRLTAPAGPELRPLIPVPVGNNTHPKNSPALPVGQFGARDTTNGGTGTGAGFGFRVKWITRYKVSVSDWVDQVANGFPISELHPVPLAGTIVVRTGANVDRSVNYTHPQAGPAVTYLLLNPNDTVSGVTRSGRAAESKSGTMPDSTPFWCGPVYPAHPPCYFYHGTPGSATFERLDAEVELTADSASAGYGSNVKFVLQAVPAYVEGQPMAISIDSTAWIADEDSLGGDWNDAAMTGACTWDNPLNFWVTRQCTRTIRSSGTLRVRGGINGKSFEKTWHITRTDAYPIVTAKRYFVSAGQRDTFTVRMSDGSAFSSLRWTWAADSGTAQSQIVCALYANPCNGSIIRESGNMRARVLHNGAYKYSQVHVTVGTRPRLRLVPQPNSTMPNLPVRFVASASGAPVTISGWAYNGTAVACGSVTTCDYAPSVKGQMWVYGSVDGFPDSASASVSVCPTDNPVLNEPEVRDSLMSLLTRSRPDVAPGTGMTPGNPYSSVKQEKGGYILWSPTTGRHYFAEYAPLEATECLVVPDLNWNRYKRSASDTLVAIVHTHPTVIGAVVYGCGDQVNTVTGDTLRFERWPGDTANGRLPAPPKGDETHYGGGSRSDWAMLGGAADGYVLNADGDVFWLRKELWNDLSGQTAAGAMKYQYQGAISVCNW